MIFVKVILAILALCLLYRLMIWAMPIATAIGAGYLAFQSGSGWLIAIGAGFAGAVLVSAAIAFGMACRSPWVRLPIMIVFVGPVVWAGAIAAHSMSIQTGAQGELWPLVAGAAGGLVFGVLAFLRLTGMADRRTAPAQSPAFSRDEHSPPAEPKVVYYHPIRPVRPRLPDARSENDSIIDL